MEKRTWSVTAAAFNRLTGIPVGEARTEVVDSDNVLFSRCELPMDVKNAYESFWNNLNEASEHVVFVSMVMPGSPLRKF